MSETSSVTSNNEVISFSIPNPSELVKDSEKMIQERKVHFEKAYTMAIEHILKNNETLALKMKNDAQNGRFRTILYTFSFNDVRDTEVDSDNIMIRFDGVYLRDMCMKGNRVFFEKMANTFNVNNNEKKYRCNFFFDKKTKKYNIYVSWGDRFKYTQNNVPKQEQKTLVPPKFKPRNSIPPPFNPNNGGRGNSGGRGNGGGRGFEGRGRGRGFEGRGGRGPLPPKKKVENVGNK